MDKYEKQLLNHAINSIANGLETLHRFLGRMNAREDFRPDLHFATPDENVIAFPNVTKSAQTVEEVNKMLIELNVKYKARKRKDGKYEIRPYIGGKRVSIYGWSAEEIAQKYKALLKKSTTQVTKASGPKLYEWLEEWLEIYKKPNVAKSTYNALVYCIQKQIKGNLKDKALSRYTLTELIAALNKIESTRMRKYARGVLQASFACAITAGKIKNSPAQNIPPVKHVSTKGKALPLSELAEVLPVAAQELPRSSFLYFAFCLFSGARREEARLLMWEDCDFKNKIIYLHGTKTLTSNRRIPMSPILEKILNAAKQPGTERPFPITAHRADKDFHVFRSIAPNAVLHWLRHTYGTIQICVEHVNANTVAMWLGHTDASTTMDIYTHPEDLAPDIYFSGQRSEPEKNEILRERYNIIISSVENFL